MSTHNIGFYEDLTKIIYELSSNIIQYAPYFFCCKSFSHFSNKSKGSFVIYVHVLTIGFLNEMLKT